MSEIATEQKQFIVEKLELIKAFKLMATAKTLAEKYEANKEITAKPKTSSSFVWKQCGP